MTLTATAHSIRGTLRQDVVIDGRHHLITDEPERVGGDGSAPSPHELLAAALASCISTVITMYARTREWDLGEVEVAVRYDPTATPRRYDVAVHLTGDLTDDQLARFEKVASTCPVRRSLEGEIEILERVAVLPGGAPDSPTRKFEHRHSEEPRRTVSLRK